MADEVKFYMQKASYDSTTHTYSTTPDSTKWVDIEDIYRGLKYSSAKGLYSKGKVKNVYTESFADSDILRVWQDNTKVAREATTIELTFYFIGADRQDVFQRFYDFVKTGRIFFYDTKRLMRSYMVLTEEVTPSDDIWKGSKTYMEIPFKFQNLYGECEVVGEDGIQETN